MPLKPCESTCASSYRERPADGTALARHHPGSGLAGSVSWCSAGTVGDGLMCGIAGAEPPDLCVVVLNYDGGTLVAEAVRATFASINIRLGVVVVDNGSSDGSLDGVQRITLSDRVDGSPPHLLTLRTNENLGFAAGNNIGLWSLPARYIALLNNDALPARATLATLVTVIARHPRV